MKYSKRVVCLLAAASLCAPRAEAQVKPFSFNVYGEAAFPAGNMQDVNTAGFGVGIGVEAKLPAKLAATASFGLMHFGGKDVSATLSRPSINAFPLRIGAKYRFKIVYVGLETGAVFSGIRDAANTAKDRSAGLIAPAVGVRFLNIDIRGKYETWFNSQYQFWGIQASVHF